MENSLYERTNPVSKTAVATLIQLAAAGYEQSGKILKRLGFRKEDYAWSLGDEDKLDKICMVASRESRYVALNRAVLESGCEIVYDLPCGFVHRAFDMADNGRMYVGGDLPAVIHALKPVILGMLSREQRSRVRFAEVDVTNYDSMNDALKGLEGPICICTEGLLVYLDASEKQTVMQNIFRLLRERGGCWITVDTETLARHLAVYSSIAGDRAPEILMKEMKGFSGDAEIDIADKSTQYLKKSGTELERSGRKDGTEKERPYLQNGFLVEKIPFEEGIKLRSYAFLQPEVVEKVKKALAGIHVWKLTVNPDFVPETADSSDGKFHLRTETVKGTLRFTLSGRLDSLSAPLFLKSWEKKKASGEIGGVEIDCTGLQYISSAGLRVLIMIRKAFPDSPMKLSGVSPAVEEILKTSAFTNLFEICPSSPKQP